ncbi:ABC transporter permease subunit/CPBP intramembrane protease [Thalassoroseus pseudoceratinae]|uniref:ABC transporter permease subunit/CPBP intramembrane protease n=1 Tax=Thalassoroseus pseudoceratinae TaxID=2713176 RepID=UPI001421A40C|nr:ABC transporter permease subunit/CPBP intramembrane protease [Thalassoroseus pseudoceratinae]
MTAIPHEPENPADVSSSASMQRELISKELRETLRDRRTIITLLAMPILLYPMLGLGFRFLAVQEFQQAHPEIRLALATEQEAVWLHDALKLGERLLDAQSDRGQENEPDVNFLMVEDAAKGSLRDSVASGQADLGVRVSLEEDDQDRTAEVTVIQKSNSQFSRDAAAFVESRLQAYELATVSRQIKRLDRNFERPVQQSTEWIVGKESTSAILGLLPLVLLLMTVTGGVYPAIDLTAGERERDTMETLMAMPIPKFRILIAKFTAVLTVTLMTGLMNLIAMTATVFALSLETTLFGEQGLTLALAGQLFWVLFVFAVFYSSVLLVLTSSAKSFKEAQAYLIPLLLVSLTPGLIIFLPGWELNQTTSIVPVINMLLLARGLFEGTASLLPAAIATISTLLYSIAALALAARVFGADAVAVGSRGGWTDLRKRPESEQSLPECATVIVTMAAMFPAFFIASGLLGRLAGASMLVRLVSSGLLTATLFAAVPIAVLIWRRVRLANGLQLHGAPIAAWVGAAILGGSCWPWVFELVVSFQSWTLDSLDESKRQQVETLLQAWKAIPLPIVVFSLGILPGICEEVFFRGFFMSGIRRQANGRVSIIAAAVAFGVFHIVLAGGAAPERLLPSTMMGLILGWVAWSSGSILPAILMHCIHNSTLLTIASFRDELNGWGLGNVEQTHLPTIWLVGSLLGTAIGCLLVWTGTRRKDSTA